MQKIEEDVAYDFSKVQSGLEFLLSHFSKPLFPRKVATAATAASGEFQRPVDSKERAMLYGQAALWEDFRINAFGINQTNPDLVFIDLDTLNFASMRAFKLALTRTLKNTKEKIGGHPAVIWSGRGYHVIQPIHCPVPLEQIKKFADLEPNTSNAFLQFAERYLSNGKCDNSNNPAIKSCLLRVPGSLNSKCKAAGVHNAEVKILQEWDGHRPDYNLLLGSFYAHLVGAKAQRQKLFESSCGRCRGASTTTTTTTIVWIERLLQTPIDDYRQNDAVALIIAPYLINVKYLDPNNAYDIIMEWLDKCEQLRPLSSSRREANRKVERAIYNSQKSGIRNMRISILKSKNPWLYEMLNLRGVIDYGL